jgi:energy-coupling factor transport system ATP-binding protein
VLEFENVSFCYKRGQYAVQNVSLKVADGEFVAVVGRNGSGKTTLTRLVMSLLKPAAGRILLDGGDTTELSTAAMARHIGYVFQNPDRQIFRDTVAEETAYGPEQLGFSAADAQAAVAEALSATGLTDLAGAYPRSLSKGQKQRLAIASALALKPRMLILDEPTSGQDAGEKLALMDLLTGLNARGVAILLVTHDMELVARYAQRAVVMAEGRKVFDGGVRQLFTGCDLAGWGLREPVAARLSRRLGGMGIAPAILPDELISAVCVNGREAYA